MRTHGNSGHATMRATGLQALVLVLLPAAGWALTAPTLRDVGDPVPPGGVLTYRITLSDRSAAGPTAPYCFNPPPECVTMPVTCSNPPPSCVGNAIAGFICQNAANDGADCGVGAPLAPDPNLCIPRTQGVCSGGPNTGLACTAPHGSFTAQCPGFTFTCARAVNEGAYCGSETPPPPHPEISYCLANPTGICSGGPNFGLACSAPHGSTTAECPTDAGPGPTPTNVTVELPLLPGLTFLDADNGGTSNGSQVTWTVPPLTACGVPGTPRCPTLQTRLLVDPLVPEGTVFANQATATDQDGFVVSSSHRTTVARFRLRTLSLSYPSAANRDKVVYRSLFAFTASESIDPEIEPFGLRISDANGTIADLALTGGQLVASSARAFTFRGNGPGFRRVVLRSTSPLHYSIRAVGAGLDLADLGSLDVTVTLTIGDDVLSHPARLSVRRAGLRYIAVQSTSTTTIVSPPTTTTTLP